jgi:hypothetical protein
VGSADAGENTPRKQKAMTVEREFTYNGKKMRRWSVKK